MLRNFFDDSSCLLGIMLLRRQQYRQGCRKQDQRSVFFSTQHSFTYHNVNIGNWLENYCVTFVPFKEKCYRQTEVSRVI